MLALPRRSDIGECHNLAAFNVLVVTFPFFALVLCGVVAARRSLLPPQAIPGLNGFVLDCAFYSLALRRIEAEMDLRNVAFGSLHKSLGFTPEGILRVRWVTKGEARDVELFGLLRPEWRS